jgi:hypothetical protein
LGSATVRPLVMSVFFKLLKKKQNKKKKVALQSINVDKEQEGGRGAARETRNGFEKKVIAFQVEFFWYLTTPVTLPFECAPTYLVD